jgi:hypothetical protein
LAGSGARRARPSAAAEGRAPRSRQGGLVSARPLMWHLPRPKSESGTIPR